MKKLCLAFAFLFLAMPPARAQLTTVSGTVKDLNGIAYAGAQMKAQIVTTAGSPVSGQPTMTVNNQAQCVSGGFGSAPCQVPFQGTVGPFALSSTGSFTVNLQDNTQVTPSGTQWLFTVNTQGNAPPLGTGPQVCTAQISIAGASQNVSTAFAACPALGNGASSIGAAVNVKSQGAVGNGKFFVDGASNASNNQLTSATATFSASDLNQNISCVKSPLSPSALVAINSTVTSFVNSSTITYGGANASNFANMFCALTNPADPSAILTAFNNCKTTFNAIFGSQSYQAPACNIYLPSGVWGLSHTLSNFVSTGSEGCVGILGDGRHRTVIIPTATFTQGGVVAGQIYDGRCVGAFLKDFSIEMSSIPTPNPGNTCGIISVSGNSTIEDVAVYDHSNLGGVGTLYGICAPTGGANVTMINPTVISGGAMAEGGLSITGSQGTILNPFLSNTTQNLLITNAATGNNGNGLAILGGVIDEGSITSIVNSQDVWITGTTLTGGANCISVDATSFIWLTGGYCGTFATNAGGGPTVASGGVLNMTQVHIRAQNAGNSCYTSAAYGGIVDDGTNNCTTAGGGTVYPAGGTINKTSLTHAQMNAFQSGTLATTTNLMGYIVDQPLVVSSMSWTPGNAFACTAGSFPTFSITDGTNTLITSVNDTASNGTVTHTFPNTTASILNASGTVGTQLRFAVVTTGTCGTAPTNTNINVWWQATAPGL